MWTFAIGFALRLVPASALQTAAPATCTIDWAVGDVVTRPEWDSGLTTSLSPWKTLDCSTFGPQYTLQEVGVNREPKKNLDNFVARLEGTCREFTPLCGGGGPSQEVEVYASAYREGTWTPGANWTEWPAWCVDIFPNFSLRAGFALMLSEGKNYVKNVAIRRLDIWNLGNDHLKQCGTSNYAFQVGEAYLEGDQVELDCGENVLTAMSLRYDTRNGKIRRVKIECRAVAERK